MNGVLNRAVGTRNNLELIYVDGKGNMSQRKIRVVDVRENHVLAYCYRRNKVRSFRKDGILSVYPCRERKGAVNG
ncbi:hypothetical protein SAMN05192559_104111 [Halobacillus karajensis]|uniref:hypothetical protein n=1 Tax=Halobacillus karajensis TaxID=195088 RepID=UPI0008A753A2|nr:hypothetical protein [Halobacillus karajensis]SEH78661.1 hypothetical protein SAMN05192559_104111 [Halobacillus karajensis]